MIPTTLPGPRPLIEDVIPLPKPPFKKTGPKPRPDGRPAGGRGEPFRAGGARARSARPGPQQSSATPEEGLERLQKVLASAGLGSRRACEELITTGRVEVDRQVVTLLGTKVDPGSQEIRVDGERLPREARVVYMLNKPVGVVTTNYDPTGRPRVVDLVPGEKRLFAIGRLDRMSEGLILVTNDGDLANRVAHPRYGVEKRYHVQVAGVPDEETLDKLRRGVPLAEGIARVRRVAIRSQHKQSSVLEMVLDEGKNREIRRMLAALGHKVHQLKRVSVGSLSLGDLMPGQWRRLGWQEIQKLKEESVPGEGGRVPDRGRPPAPQRRGRPSWGPRGTKSGTDRVERRGKPVGGKPVGGKLVGGKRRRVGRASDWRRPRGERPGNAGG